MPTLFVAPIGPAPSEWQTIAKPPWKTLQSSFPVYLPAGPHGLFLACASLVHLPAKYSSFLCSGPGLGASDWARAGAEAARMQAAAARMLPVEIALFMLASRNRIASRNTYEAGRPFSLASRESAGQE